MIGSLTPAAVHRGGDVDELWMHTLDDIRSP